MTTVSTTRRRIGPNRWSRRQRAAPATSNTVIAASTTPCHTSGIAFDSRIGWNRFTWQIRASVKTAMPCTMIRSAAASGRSERSAPLSAWQHRHPGGLGKPGRRQRRQPQREHQGDRGVERGQPVRAGRQPVPSAHRPPASTRSCPIRLSGPRVALGPLVGLAVAGAVQVLVEVGAGRAGDQRAAPARSAGMDEEPGVAWAAAIGTRFAAVSTTAPAGRQWREPIRSASSPVGISNRQNAT